MADNVVSAEDEMCAAKMNNEGETNEMTKQSPINITKEITDHDAKLKASQLKFKYIPGDLKTVQVTETGLTCKTDDQCTSVLTAPHLPGTYQLWELHAHWGTKKNSGSEHSLQGKAFSMEAHFVFWNKKYGEFSECLAHSDGLAVLALLMEENPIDNEEFAPIIDGVQESLKDFKAVSIASHFDPIKLLPDKLCYYTYEGSLTTKPFRECVIWTVLKRHAMIGCNQLEVLRKIVAENYRNQQELNGRRVRSSFKFVAKSAHHTDC